MKGTCEVIRGDAFKVAAKFKDGSFPLLVMDPPYGGILLGEKWDRRWSIEDYEALAFVIERLLTRGGTAYVFGGIGTYKHRLFFTWLSWIEHKTSLRIWDVITWRKRRAYGVKDKYLFIREECAMLIKGARPAVFNIPLLDKERGYEGYNKDYPAKSKYLRRGNVWDDVNELFRGKIHPAEKPSRLAEIMISTSSNPGDKVLDLFAGSGSTGVAAVKLGRHATLIEASNCKMHLE